MAIISSSVFAPRYSRKWGVWKFTKSGLHNTKADYFIAWNRINHASDVLGWLIQISGKNRRVYGETVTSDLMDAFQEVLGLWGMDQSTMPIDAAAKASAHHAKLKEQSDEASL